MANSITSSSLLLSNILATTQQQLGPGYFSIFEIGWMSLMYTGTAWSWYCFEIDFQRSEVKFPEYASTIFYGSNILHFVSPSILFIGSISSPATSRNLIIAVALVLQPLSYVVFCPIITLGISSLVQNIKQNQYSSTSENEFKHETKNLLPI